MTPSYNCIDLIKKWEGFEDKAYQCSAGRWTIGWGSTMYQDGNKVKQGDVITKETAEKLLMWELTRKSAMIKTYLNQNQFDALCCMSYNIGIGALLDSTLYKKARLNPNDPMIADEFLRWNKVKGKPVDGLTKRRIDESNLYFSKL
jgi:lysozyme